MEKFCEHVNAEVIPNNSILKELDEERIAHSETRAHLKTVKEQPCSDADQHSLEISKIETHFETKDEIAFLQTKVKELESQLLEKITNLDAIREEHLDYKRQLEAEEIANSYREAQEISKEKINLENQLAATHNPPSQQENLRNFSKLSLRSRTANKTSPSPLVPLYTKKLRYEYK
ncbi:hypothetical protein DAPPUDRAFT_330125 [Daphnia pulex]|uniref:Uncharacterized protein n=1 Tax=Daphnia pulex TaxID=6669 RepID=E9HIL8_DAPPU|nr:hypothetical protein DAPPUDRAFT_330125 [Daphnia pulex]|eukprot:EFX68380.1 hypothetical protein DAPPUDRAFT_330125 [Daphnia pulex]